MSAMNVTGKVAGGLLTVAASYAVIFVFGGFKPEIPNAVFTIHILVLVIIIYMFSVDFEYSSSMFKQLDMLVLFGFFLLSNLIMLYDSTGGSTGSYYPLKSMV